METMATGTQCILFLLLCSISLSRSQDVQMPPSLTTGPPALIHYKEFTSVYLHCIGVGSSSLTYEWTRNGQPLYVNVDNIEQVPGIGTIVIAPCRATDQGYYQCILTNSFGKTMSNVTFLQMATLETFPPQTGVIEYHRMTNEQACLSCAQLQSIPASHIYWTYNYTGLGGPPIPVNETTKIQTNPFTGGLCFGDIQDSDGAGTNNKMYICNVQNTVLLRTESGSLSKIKIIGTGLANSAPIFQFGSPAALVGMEGDPLTLRGFFSGSSIPSIVWQKNGQTPPQNRWTVTNSGTGLTLTSGRLTAEDAGEFTCQGANGIGNASTHTIQLTIHARPFFLNNSFQPHDMNVTDGDPVTIKCDPYAVPDATIIWYKNGVSFTSSSLPPKFSLSADSKTLTISGVCKTCNKGNTGDLMNIQCNTSNEYGYGFAQGYLNVLEATVITSVGGNRVWNPYTNEVFDCQATSDESSPVIHTWYHNDIVVQESETVIVALNGSLFLLMQNEADGGQSHIGQYRCVASNGVSEAELTYTLDGNVQMPPSLTTGPTTVIYTYKETASVTLQCEGVGSPTPTYTWTKNGQPLNINSGNIEQLPGLGTIVINPCLAGDQGYYQCILMNSFGKTMSNMTFLQMATLETFTTNSEAYYYVDKNGHVCLACEKLQSIPASLIYWTYDMSGSSGQPSPVTESTKIQTNPFEGALCLTHVQDGDSVVVTNKWYICNVQNTVLSRIESGSKSKIFPTLNTSASYAPILTFGSAAALVGLEGDPLTLRGFFSGSPIPSIIWQKNGQTPPQNRWNVTNSGTGLTLIGGGLTAEDAGEFTCQGSNGIGSAMTHTIQLTIHARPVFLNNSFRPHDMNVTEGDTVTINCDPHAIPNVTITWYMNGVALTSACKFPPKFSLSADSKTLTISGVCKTCNEGNTGDLMNIQCNASNEYGYGFAQGYLNVLEATVITSVGGSRVWIPYNNEVFDCRAISDHSTPVGRTWYYNDTVVQESETVILAGNGSLVLLMQNEADGGESRIGQYRCVASNGFSEAELIHTLDEIVRMPPSLVTGPTTLVHYKETASVTLDCVGVGIPDPTYEWTKNGQPLNVNSGNIEQIPGLGTIVINPCLADDQGYYQCKLTNSFGKTMSNMTFLQMATFETFPSQTEATPYNVDINFHVCLACAQLPSIPASNIYWTYNYTGLSGPPIRVTETSKIQTNPFSGELCLTHVQVDDGTGSNNKMYICNAQNTVLARIDSGSHSKILTTGTTSASYAPFITFGSAAALVGLEGDPLTLRCFFSGSPVPSIIWQKNGQTPPQNRWSGTNSGTGLTLIDGRLTAEDAGEFTCQGSNGIGSAVTHTIQLTIHARPVFLNNSFQPHDMNVTEGDTVTINCDPHAIPDATINWYKNGVPFTACTPLSPKFSLSADSKTLTIFSVCKTCNEGNSGDLMNIQCNASNEYGYAFAQGYLNVLGATVITSVGGNRVWNPYTNEVFDCQAISDHSTPVVHTWYFNGIVVQESETVILAVNGSLVLLMQNEKNGGQSRVGQYRCVASNGVSEVELTYTLDGANVARVIASVGGNRVWMPYTNEVLDCKATTDHNTPVVRKWYYNDVVVQESDTVILAGNGSLVLLVQNEKNGGQSRVGQYRCLASNGFSEAELTYTLDDGNVQMPPSLVTGPTALILYKEKASVTLHCEGLGTPAPSYTWTKNGQPLNVNADNIQPTPGVGTIVINPCLAADQGYYQCILTNTFGKTMSNMTFLQMATLETFPPETEAKPYNVDINGNVCLACAQLQSIPASNIYWTYNYTGLTGQPIPVTQTSKIQTNPFSGELCLTNVQAEDGAGSQNKVYICNAYNAVLSRTDSGSHSRISITNVTSASYAPILTFGSASALVGLEGDQLTLRCFFSGSPVPSIVWRKNGLTPPQNRWIVTNVGTGLTLTSGRLTAEDAGEFTCQGSNGIGSAVTHIIQLTIHVRPAFLNNSFQPHDMNVTEGETVTINCDPRAVPDATINWFKNGISFTASSLPPKFSLSADFKTLTISGVCKTCNEGNSGDLMNIQCNASNEYGYAFAQGYLNVLGATVITSVGGTRVWNPYTNEVLDCQAISDHSPPVRRTWYHNDVVVQESETVVFAVNGSLVFLLQNEKNGGQSRVGQYRCVASNGFSEAELIYTLDGTRHAKQKLTGILTSI